MNPLELDFGRTQKDSEGLLGYHPVRESHFYEHQSLPLIIQPVADSENAMLWVHSHRGYIEERLHRYGAVLFRGFDLRTAEDFEKFAGAICGNLYAEYGDLPGESQSARIYNSTPYPEDQPILYHNESSHLGRWPGKINFFCVTPARQGGATPIVDCRKVYQQLDPHIRQRFEQSGVMYVRNFHEGLDVSWQRFFRTDDKSVVEESCLVDGMTCEWIDSDLRISRLCRAVIRHPVTGEPSFFNQVQLHHLHCLPEDTRESLLSVFESEDLPRNVCYGDGSPIEDSVIDHIGDIYERNAVRFTWHERDMICLDNMLVAHARDPFAGPRKILVALGDMIAA